MNAPAQAAKYNTVAATLYDQIRAGHFKQGDLLPSEPALCRRFGVSRHTVRAALRTLHEKGLIESRQGRGSTVLATTLVPRYTHACNSVQDIVQYAAETTRRVVDRTRRLLDQATAAWLGCAPGYPWWEVRTCRLRGTDGPVVASSTIWVPDTFADVVAELDRTQEPLFVLVQRHHGANFALIRQAFSVATASAHEADDLGLAPASAVMCVERRFLDERGGVLEVSRTVHPPDSFRYEMSLRQVLGA